MTLTALITPFLNDFSIDWISFEKLLILQLTSKIDGLVILATTGETPTLTLEEENQIVTKTLELNIMLKANKKIYIGVSDNSTSRVVARIESLNDLEFDGYLIASPSYNKPQQDGLCEHFLACSRATHKNIMLYNVPGRSGVNILPQTVAKIVENTTNIRFIKEASGSVEQIMDLLLLVKTQNLDLKVLSGDDSLTLPILSLGGAGVVSVLSNMLPNETADLVNFYKENWQKSQEIHFQLLSKMRDCFTQTNPVPIKNMLFNAGIISSNEVRLPLVKMN